MAMALGFSWLTAHTYLRLREISADKGNFPEIFRKGRSARKRNLIDLENAGYGRKGPY